MDLRSSLAVVAKPKSTGYQPNVWAKQDAWDGHRALITHLYAKNSLPEVMRVMEAQHAFRATKKMYKSRIKQWCLDKKNKEPEMKAIVCKKLQRSSQGKPSQFHVRGKLVRFEDVVRYWERKGVSIEDVFAHGTNALSPAAVECLTPILSPVTTPEIFATPERIFSTICDYCRGSFEVGTWVMTDQKIDCNTTKGQGDGFSRLDAFYEQIVTACRLFAMDSCEEAGKTLIAATATADIKMILLAEHPYLLKTLLDLLLFSGRHGRREVVVIVLKQISTLCELILGDSHPLRRLCGWLAAIRPSEIEETAFRSLQGLQDHFGSILGPMHRSTLRLHCDRIRFKEYGGDIDRGWVELNGLLTKCVDAFGLHDGRTLRVYLELAIHFWIKSSFVEGERTARNIMVLAGSAQPVSSSTHFWIEGLYQLAISQYGLQDKAAAEAKLRLAVDLRIAHFGAQDARARNLMVVLERWLTEGGQLWAASEVRARREGMIKPADLPESTQRC